MRLLIHVLLLSLSLALGAQRPAQADELPREVVVNGVEFMHVPQGWFWYPAGAGYWKDMESPNSAVFRDVHTWLSGFYIAKFEARGRDLLRLLSSGQARYSAQYVKGEMHGCAVRRRPGGEYYLTKPSRDLAATHLSWQLADEFARWMGFRLPTEAEWSKAARGSDRRAWPWGNEYPDDTFAGYGIETDCLPNPVDAYRNGISPYGVHNMAGNVLEYVADWFSEEFDASMKDGQHNPPLATHGTLGNGRLDGPRKILKGGGRAANASVIHVYSRSLFSMEGDFVDHGVRFALDEDTVRAHLAKGTATIVTKEAQ